MVYGKNEAPLVHFTAYCTLATTTTWTIADYPLASAVAIAAEGTFFSCVTSAAATWWELRRMSSDTSG